MSNYHILETDKELKTVNVIFHIPIPAVNNAVGVPYRTVLVSHLGGINNITSSLLDITSAELADIKSGAIFEQRITVRFTSLYLTNAQRLQQVINAYNDQKQLLLNDIQQTLAFYGKSGDV